MILMALHTHGAEKLSATALVDTVSTSALLFLVIQKWVWNESLSLFGVEAGQNFNRKEKHLFPSFHVGRGVMYNSIL